MLKTPRWKLENVLWRGSVFIFIDNQHTINFIIVPYGLGIFLISHIAATFNDSLEQGLLPRFVVALEGARIFCRPKTEMNKPQNTTMKGSF